MSAQVEDIEEEEELETEEKDDDGDDEDRDENDRGYKLASKLPNRGRQVNMSM